MRLYVYPHSPLSRKVLLAVYEKGLSIEREVIAPYDEPGKRRLRQTYHPLATIPMLILDDGTPMPESSIIVEYLDRSFSHAPELLPRDPMAALHARALDRLGDVLLNATSYLAWALRKPKGEQHESKVAASFETVRSALSWLDIRLASNSYLFGESLTFADLGAICAVASLLADQTLHDLAPWPGVSRWHQAVTHRPAWRRMIEDARDVPLPAGFEPARRD